MRIIAHSPANNTSYVINPHTCLVEWAGSHEACEAYIEYMKFYDFYYSVKDIHGRSQIPSVTMDYLEMMNNNHRLYPACGWWNKTMIPTLGDPFDPDRFIDCTTYHTKVCKTCLNTD